MEADRLTTVRFYLFDYTVNLGLRLWNIGDRDIVAVASETSCNCTTDALGSTGDKRDAVQGCLDRRSKRHFKWMERERKGDGGCDCSS